MLKNEKLIHIVAVALLLIAVQTIVFAEYFGIPNRKESSFQNGTACTQEAKLCPDGSYVSRTGPNCEFEECPTLGVGQKVVTNFEECMQVGYPIGESYPRQCFAPNETFVEEIEPPLNLDTSTWKTYRNEEYGFEVRYPQDWLVKIWGITEGSLSFDIVSPTGKIEDPLKGGIIHLALLPVDVFENTESFCQEKTILHPFGCTKYNSGTSFYEFNILTKNGSLNEETAPLDESNMVYVNKSFLIKSELPTLKFVFARMTIWLNYYELTFNRQSEIIPLKPDEKSQLEKIKNELKTGKIPDSSTDSFIKIFDMVIPTFKFTD